MHVTAGGNKESSWQRMIYVRMRILSDDDDRFYVLHHAFTTATKI
jgi:hypothetical protein